MSGATLPVAGFRLRAILLERTREFFRARDVLEVETPLLRGTSVTDPHIESVRCGERYLQTSPEYAMKRLVASGSGPVYQICKAFRAGEDGGRHNVEFTLLEWYRPGFDHHRLMDEVDDYLQHVLGTDVAERVSYGELFRAHTGVDPHTATLQDLEVPSLSAGALESSTLEDRLDLRMSHEIEPELGLRAPVFVYDYPVGMAALARIRDGDPPVAERFEVYYRGIELANGYHELTDPAEQRARFERDNARRLELGREPVEPDEGLLQALEAGLPDCAGVALGFDRLLMIAAGARSIRDVLGAWE